MAGVDLRTVAQLTGHNTVQMAMRYAPLAPNLQRNTVERIVSDAFADSSKTRGGLRLAEKAGQK